MSDALARPTFTPFELDAEYVWLECDLPKYEGFRVEVRMNLKNRDRKRLNILLDEITAEREHIGENSLRIAKDIEDRKKIAADANDEPALAELAAEQIRFVENASASYDENAAKLHAAITPYVRRWNVMDRDYAGKLVDAPAPMTAGVEAFELIDQKMVGWLVGAILGAYRGGKGFSDSSVTPGESDEVSSASTETTPKGKPPTNRSGRGQSTAKNSRSRSRSTSATSGPGSSGKPMPLSST